MFLLNLIGFNFLTIVPIFLVTLYLIWTKNYNYWKSRGIDGPMPIIGLGTIYPMFYQPVSELFVENVKKYGRIAGGYFGIRPTLTLTDPEVIRDIGIKDFHIFVDRNDFNVGDVLNERSLFNLRGDEWKNIRAIISPTFSSGKMKRMHPIITGCVNRLETVLDKNLKTSSEINLKKMTGKLTMDVIATCAFGTTIDVYNDDKESEFVTYAKKVFKTNWRIWVFFIVSPVFPQLLKWFNFKLTDPSVDSFFRSAIRSIVSQRKSDKHKHNDYLQLLLNAQNKTEDREEHTVDDDKTDEIFGQTDQKHTIKTKTDITEDDLLANTFLFFVAGYETTASLLAHLFYSMAVNEECQQKLYEEVKTFDGKFDYESINKMPYMEACVAETLRKYPPIPSVMRMASEEYTIAKTGLKIPKGMIVNFNIQGLHYDPEYYPNPKRFDPERFMPENRDKLVQYTYMPFGIGPRNCVGMRFALMEAKTAIAHLINKYRFFRIEKTAVPLIPLKGEFILNHGDIRVGIELRK